MKAPSRVALSLMLAAALVPATARVAEGLITESVGGKSLVEIFAEAGCKDIAPPSCAA